MWGTSFSGGHVLYLAAHLPNIDAVISRVPFIDGLKSLANRPVLDSIKLAIKSIGLLFGQEIRIPVIGKPDETAFMNTPDAYLGYKVLLPDGYEPLDYVLAELPFYSLLNNCSLINCPVLIQTAEFDSITPRSL